MKIEIAQVITHIIGFLITVWLLKRYAWKLLWEKMEERKNRIKDDFRQIEVEKAKAAQLLVEYESKLKNIEQERRQKINEAITEANKYGTDIKAHAQDEARQIVARTAEQLEQDIARARVQLKEEMVNITLLAAEKILHEKLDEKKERVLIDRFIDGIEKA
jgi:F-type H+-transporting ATPase subunit b